MASPSGPRQDTAPYSDCPCSRRQAPSRLACPTSETLPAGMTATRTASKITIARPRRRALTEGRSPGIPQAPRPAPAIRMPSQPRQAAASHRPGAEASSLSSMATGKKPASASRSRWATRHGRRKSASPTMKQAAQGTATSSGYRVNAPPTTAGTNQPPPLGRNPCPTGTQAASAASAPMTMNTSRPVTVLSSQPGGRDRQWGTSGTSHPRVGPFSMAPRGTRAHHPRGRISRSSC